MSIWYVDLESGSESNDGLSWANSKLTTKGIPVASILPGDEIRIAKSADPALVGNATWIDGSPTVTLAAPAPSLTMMDFVSRTSVPYWGEWPWHSIASIAGTTVTLNRPYRGPSGAFPLYSRRPARPAPLGSVSDVLIGFGATGSSTILVDGVRLSGGWNRSTGLQDGQTFIDGQTKVGCALRVTTGQSAGRVDVSRLSFARFDTQSVSGYVSPTGTLEIDNALEGGVGGPLITYGSGNSGQHGACRVNVVAGSGADGLHIHTSWGNTIEVGKVFDCALSGISQNNDYMWQTGGTFRVGEVAYCSGGIGRHGGTSFNYVIDTDWVIGSIHDCPMNGIGIECPGANTFLVGRAYNNGADIYLDGNTSWILPSQDEYGNPIPGATPSEIAARKQTFIAPRLESAVPVSNPYGVAVEFASPVATTVYDSDTEWHVDVPVDGLSGVVTFDAVDSLGNTVSVEVPLLDGAAAGHAGAAGTLSIKAGQDGIAAGHAGAAATITQKRPLTGAATGHADGTTGTPTVSVPSGVPLVGTAPGHAGAAAAPTQRQPLAGTAAGKATAEVASALGGASDVIVEPARRWDFAAQDGSTISIGLHAIMATVFSADTVGLAGVAAGGAGAVALEPGIQYPAAVALEGSAAGQAGATGTEAERRALAGTAAGRAAASAVAPVGSALVGARFRIWNGVAWV